MKKKLLILLLAVVCSFTLFGCQNSVDEQTEQPAETNAEDSWEQEQQKPVLSGEDLAKTYPLECKEILIVTDNNMAFGGEASVETYDITDKTDVEKIVECANLGEWSTSGSFYDGIYSWAVVFDGKIAMRFDDDFSYCAIGEAEKSDDGTYSIKPSKYRYCDYNVPAEFSEVLQNMLAKYSNQ
jgi:uncharacterized lipoprotein NlpE involved in copper resistance